MSEIRLQRIDTFCGIMRKLASLPLVLTAGLFFASPSQAASFSVNTTLDAVDAAPGNGVCATSTGACTLRAAIQETNALAGADIITLPAGTYTLTIPGKDEDAAATGDLDITGTGDLIITGAGAGSTRIAQSGTGAADPAGRAVDRVFHFIGRNNVTITGVTIEKGYAYAAAPGGRSAGAGIYNTASWLTLKDCGVSQNVVEWPPLPPPDVTDTGSAMGGGIYNASGARLDVDNCVIANNTVAIAAGVNTNDFNGGGGVYNAGQATITQTIIDANYGSRYGQGILNIGTLSVSASIIRNNRDTTAPGPGAISSSGGAIANVGGAVTLQDSLVEGNMAAYGGAIHNQTGFSPGFIPGRTTVASFTVLSSAIRNNTAQSQGGGINNEQAMVIRYSSISGNTTTSIFPGDGGGIANWILGDLILSHSTVSGNRAGRAGGGIFNAASARLNHVTLGGNQAATVIAQADNQPYVLGNEVFVHGNMSQNDRTEFQNTLIQGTAPAGNCLAGQFTTPTTSAFSFEKPDVFGATTKVASKGYNLDNGNSCALDTAANDLINTSAVLAALVDAGGGLGLPGNTPLPRLVRVPQAGSPAIDAIPAGACPTPGVDQLLNVRPDATSGRCDIGALEVGSVAATLADLQVILSTSSEMRASLRAADTTGLGDPVNYTITVKNNGPAAAPGPITITQTLDAGAVMQQGGNPPKGIACRQENAVITCAYDKGLANGEAIEIYVSVRPPLSLVTEGKKFNSTVTVSAGGATATVDYVPENNQSSLATTVRAVTEPIPNSNASSPTSGGGGAFGAVVLAVLGGFGVWRVMRRRI